MKRYGAWGGVAALLIATIVLAIGCATNPVTGRREVSLVSSGQELQIGQEGYKAVLQEYGVYNDKALQDYVNTVGQKVAKVSHLPGLEWHFTLLDDPTVNAFAMPGGYIYITRGILAHLNSEAQLAGVLGHEVGHVTHRHTAERITQQQLYGLGLGLASVFSPTFRQYGQVAEQALGLLFLKYSRTDEEEADALGVEYSFKAGYDPREISKTYSMLKRVGDQSGQRLPSFLSTHPDPGAREQTTARLAQEALGGRTTGLVVNERTYVQKLDGVVFGPDPRQGYFSGDQYYHPELRFQMTFPSGWKHRDSRSAVLAGNPAQSAAMQLTLANPEGRSPSDYVAALAARGAIAGAEGGAESIGGWPAWVGRLAVTNPQGGTPGTLAAGFARKADTQMFQILGQTQAPGDGDESVIFASIRSLRPLNDASRINVTPDRIQVTRVTSGGSFSSVAARLGVPGSMINQVAVLNNVDPDQSIPAGALIKTVVVGRH